MGMECLVVGRQADGAGGVFNGGLQDGEGAIEGVEAGPYDAGLAGVGKGTGRADVEQKRGGVRTGFGKEACQAGNLLIGVDFTEETKGEVHVFAANPRCLRAAAAKSCGEGIDGLADGIGERYGGEGSHGWASHPA